MKRGNSVGIAIRLLAGRPRKGGLFPTAERDFSREICCSNSCVDDDLSLLGCDGVWMGGPWRFE
jgi:hypothetical protein